MLHRIVGVLLLVFVGVLLALKFRTHAPPVENQTPSDYSLLREVDKDLIQLRLREGDHKITLMNFWASWCVPCLKEMPDLVSINESYSPQGLQILLISTDDYKALAETVEILKRNSVNFESYFRGSLGYGILDELYPGWNGALPASLILDREGEILEAWFGETTKAQFEERIKKHL